MGRKRNKTNKNDSYQVFDKEFDTELLMCDRSPILGRYLKAKSDIKKGTIILKEKCMLSGPRISSGKICIGCHTDLSKTTNTLNCSKCSWPICTLKCEKVPHHILECRLFVEKDIKSPANPRSREFGAISILRALLKKREPGKDWKKIISLENHNEDRIKTSVWKEDEYVIKVIREYWNLTEFSEEEIHSICGIYEVNGFEMGDVDIFGGIFFKASMIAHDCVPNAGHFQNMDDGTLEIVSVLDILAGSPITMCYDCCLKGTTVRRRQLLNSKYFNCTCKRCLDPKELSTHFETLLCQNPSCKHEFIQHTMESNNEGSFSWKCNTCGTIQKDEVENLLQKYQDIAEQRLLQTIKMKEEFLEECKTIFHPNHFIPFSIKFSLCMAYGHDDRYTLFDLTPSQAHRKLELCQEVLKILDLLTPGYSTTRGNILYEIQAAEVLIARNLLDGGKCSKAIIKRKLQNSIKILNEAIVIFELSYPMRMLAKSAKTTTLFELQDFIKALK